MMFCAAQYDKTKNKDNCVDKMSKAGLDQNIKLVLHNN